MTDKRRSALEVPESWNSMTDEEKYQWAEAALAKLAGDVGTDRGTSEKR